MPPVRPFPVARLGFGIIGGRFRLQRAFVKRELDHRPAGVGGNS